MIIHLWFQLPILFKFFICQNFFWCNFYGCYTSLNQFNLNYVIFSKKKINYFFYSLELNTVSYIGSWYKYNWMSWGWRWLFFFMVFLISDSFIDRYSRENILVICWQICVYTHASFICILSASTFLCIYNISIQTIEEVNKLFCFAHFYTTHKISQQHLENFALSILYIFVV